MIKHIWSMCKLTFAIDDILIIYEDNTTYINKLKLGLIKGDDTKHITPKFFFSHEQFQEKKLEVCHIGS